MPYLKEKQVRTIEQTLGQLQEKIYKKTGELTITCYKTKEPVSFQEKEKGEKQTLKKGEKWGDLFDCAWFHFNGIIPEECKNQKTVLLIDISGEGLIVDKLGNPVRGITNVATEFSFAGGGKRVYSLYDNAQGGETVDIWMDAGCNDLFGSLKNDGKILEADIAIQCVDIRKLYYDYLVLYELLMCLAKDSARYNQILFKLYEASLHLKNYDEAEIREALGVTGKLLEKTGGDCGLSFTAIGHSHLDLAWLWPIRETIRKGARTFSNTLHYMEQYPDYKFGASQAQLYAWMKEYYPALYERVKEKIKEGKWEVQGCMWVEADTNLSGGEALVRQILYGKRFFKEEFGIEVKNLWLPDVFGYTGALPQLLKKSGCDYFMTQKLSWSEHNKFPHQTFLWQGIDGTEIFTHMLPEETYNSSLSPRQVKYAETNYIDSGICDEALILFGVGDGGGGPGSLHLESASRMKNLNGLCPVTIDFAQPLFERLEESTRGKLKKWAGELYLEKHQGTYTTQAKNKWYNRKMEFALRELEFALVLSGHLKDYPKQQLDEIWKEVLLYQFHDIIPGSSIKRVYDESLARYEILLNKVCGMTESCYKEIAANAALTAFNSLSWERTEIVEEDGSFYQMNIPALGYTERKEPVQKIMTGVGENCLENNYLRAVFDKDGVLISLYDKAAERESLSGPSNLYSVYDDLNADCWDIAIEYTDRRPEYFVLEGQKFYVKGANAICEQCYTYGNSQIIVRIQLGHESKRLEFDLKVDWKENLKMLRTSFETDVLSKEASYEIQFGQIKRPNNDNTLWQKAQFEVCAHKWVDLSEADYGIALINDCKYGYRVQDKIMDMNLLRSQNYPGENADRGTHHVRYALYPHSGNERTGQVHKQAYEFNVPVILQKGEGNSIAEGQILCGAENIVIETVKKAEDNNSCILRLYEPYGATVNTLLQFGKQYAAIYKCSLMEEEEEVIGKGDSVSLKVKPFEIVTLKLEK
ncbi:alpha-mannosidase [Anaerocolumna xylanovorans]|uniref:Alpha-mannosidase n=1 Tax=Anaerocolumna xylanovorans DSM 12503 TaxID=1121345 RepID=A0A1M7Y587_9FIRM|nr:glycoside hydrolase family 38 C-terminal domain-containing protein [Anaerocolumna xylanovorans]SHO47578.1 alpha-mannosidase [Anaerocolumna xylanovorans DSM 12503]